MVAMVSESPVVPIGVVPAGRDRAGIIPVGTIPAVGARAGVIPAGRRPSPTQGRRIRPAAVPARRSPHGRLMVTGAAALVVGALSVVLATAAQATHAGPAADNRYVTKVMVQPGQSLWTLAERYDPDADARVIVEQIRQLNSMAGDQLQAGETLWVPRG